MRNPTRLIRLITAVAVALIACGFVSLYSRTSMRVFSDRLVLPNPVSLLLTTERRAYICPLAFLLLGIWSIRKGRETTLELIISAAWLFAFAWMCLGLLAWRLAEVPSLFARPLL